MVQGAVKQGLDMTAGQAEEAVDTILHVTPAPTTQPPTLTQGTRDSVGTLQALYVQALC